LAFAARRKVVLVTTFCMSFDLPQMFAMVAVDMVNENYYRQTMNRIAEGYPEKAAPGSAAPARIPSRALLGERKELVIVHNGREYRLRLTQNGKLILTA
jgi:hemin uptake protein HemP